MPKLWRDTVEAHRASVREAILDAAEGIVVADGLLAVTMSLLAERTGIGRATLYKYFPDVEQVLLAWHGRQVQRHLLLITEARDAAEGSEARLRAALSMYARLARESGGHSEGELGALLHGSDQVGHVEKEVRALLRSLLEEAAHAGVVRADIPAAELAEYCLHALTAARALPTAAAAQRLIELTLGALAPAHAGPVGSGDPSAAPPRQQTRASP